MMNRIHTSINIARCMLVGMGAPKMAEASVRREFPGAIIEPCETVEAALEREAVPGGELLILTSPDQASFAQAVAVTDATGLRRWAIVVLGTAPKEHGVELVTTEEMNEPLLARACRSAVAQHQLVRELERARGDLRTVGFRVNHDLRTPMGGIVGAAEVIKEILAEENPSSAGLVKPIFTSVDDLTRVIERVSLLIKASVNPVKRESAPMGEIVWAARQRRERQILNRKAIVTQPDVWPEVNAVASWLEVIWGNLLDNALQYGSPGGLIELGWSREEGGFRFWVSNDGPEVPPEKLAALFQPFHLLYLPNARKGMGLSIVQRLVELQGGHCRYEAGVGGGTTFSFTLPMAAPAI